MAAIVVAVKFGRTSMRTRPERSPRLSTATRTGTARRPFSCRLTRIPGWGPPIQVSSISTSPWRGSRAVLTIARRSLWSIILETLGEVYGNDAMAHEQGLSPEERLRFHQAQSGPV